MKQKSYFSLLWVFIFLPIFILRITDSYAVLQPSFRRKKTNLGCFPGTSMDWILNIFLMHNQIFDFYIHVCEYTKCHSSTWKAASVKRRPGWHLFVWTLIDPAAVPLHVPRRLECTKYFMFLNFLHPTTWGLPNTIVRWDHSIHLVDWGSCSSESLLKMCGLKKVTKKKLFLLWAVKKKCVMWMHGNKKEILRHF